MRGTSGGVGKKDGWKVGNDQEFIIKGLAEKGRRTKNQSIHPHPPPKRGKRRAKELEGK